MIIQLKCVHIQDHIQQSILLCRCGICTTSLMNSPKIWGRGGAGMQPGKWGGDCSSYFSSILGSTLTAPLYQWVLTRLTVSSLLLICNIHVRTVCNQYVHIYVYIMYTSRCIKVGTTNQWVHSGGCYEKRQYYSYMFNVTLHVKQQLC